MIQVFSCKQRSEQHVNRCLVLSGPHDVQQVKYDRETDQQQDNQVKQRTSEQRHRRFPNQEHFDVVRNPKVSNVQGNAKTSHREHQKPSERLGEQNQLGIDYLFILRK